MIDTKYKNDNSIKFKDDCSLQPNQTIKNFSNLISNLNRRNTEQNNLITKLALSNKNLNEIEYDNKPEKETDKIANAEIVINEDENVKIQDVNLMNSNEEIDCVDANSKEIKTSFDNRNRISSSQPNTQKKPNQKTSSIPNANSFSQQPSTSQQTNQQINQQSFSQQPTNSSESHNVHFTVNRNESKSAISIGHFSIYLDRLDYEYRPSDTLTGKLHILLESGELNLRRIVIYLKGISSVK